MALPQSVTLTYSGGWKHLHDIRSLLLLQMLLQAATLILLIVKTLHQLQ